MASGSKGSSSKGPMSVHESSLRPGDAPTLAQLAALEEQKNKRKQKRKQYRMSLSKEKLKEMRQ
eukprot:IDg21275t1